MHRKHARKPKHECFPIIGTQYVEAFQFQVSFSSQGLPSPTWCTIWVRDFYFCPRPISNLSASDWSSFETKNVLETEIYGKEFHRTRFSALTELRSALSKTALFR